jgi:uncharacterized protein (DUF2141 family)
MKFILAAISFFVVSCGSDSLSSMSSNEQPTVAASEGNVTIKFEDVRLKDGGQMCITIVPEGAEFPEADPEQAVYNECLDLESVAEEGLSLALPKGTYAAAVFQDENENGILDMKKIIFWDAPAEGFGFSGNPKLRKGAPDFEDCAFKVGETANLLIKMRKI